MLPEWRVFVRRRDGRSTQFTVSQKHQLSVVAGAALLALWAGISTSALTQQPEHLAAKERELEEMMASTRAAQHRLASAEKLVAEIAHEVDTVHGNLVTLAESSDSLAKDPPGAKLARGGAKTRLAAEPAYNDDSQTGGSEAKAMREQVRRLEESLDRLRLSYTRAAQQTAEVAASRITQTEQQISRLGINTGRLVQPAKRSLGQGGPFIPATVDTDDRFAMGALIERMQHWNGMKAAMQRLPLAIPIHGEFELNSGFGTRSDPLNHRSAIHEGLDFGAPIGTPVYATGEGVVTYAEPWDRYGNTVEIDHGNGITTRYAHMSRIKVKEGQKVNRSTVIGLVGNTGRSTGSHLHYEVRLSDVAKDPIKFISVGRDAPKTR
ncbi:MAG: peptidoglycan DD-metalloendopeptidase family protein [Rhodospirillaceae bacterium]|nr:peptidoglycan DD-metalloendopeptidase family protein [Rhodospirillales bacterium]